MGVEQASEKDEEKEKEKDGDIDQDKERRRPEDKAVLSDVNLEIPKGKLVGVILLLVAERTLLKP